MRIHVGKLHRGNPYLNLGKTVQINFVDQVKMDLGDHLITNFYLTSEYDLNTKLIPESFCIKIIQIDKLKELGYNETEVIKWLKFIAAKDQEERAQIAKGDEELVELNDWIDKYVNDEETKWKMAKWADEIAENKGYEKGLEEGNKQKSIEIAKNLLSMNMPLEDIHKATGMEIEEIIKLKEEKK